MPERERALARLTIKLWMISLPLCVLGGISGAMFLKSIGAAPRTNIAITICVVFLPIAIVALHGLIRGYIPTYDLQHVRRGGYAKLVNGAALIVYLLLALIVLLRV
jgi:hypothetical protein